MENLLFWFRYDASLARGFKIYEWMVTASTGLSGLCRIGWQLFEPVTAVAEGSS